MSDCTCLHCNKHFFWRNGLRIGGIWFCTVQCYRRHYHLNASC